MNSTEQPTASASCSCVSFFDRRRSAIRLPSFRCSTQFNYHFRRLLTTQLNYGSTFCPFGVSEKDRGGQKTERLRVVD